MAMAKQRLNMMVLLLLLISVASVAAFSVQQPQAQLRNPITQWSGNNAAPSSARISPLFAKSTTSRRNVLETSVVATAATFGLLCNNPPVAYAKGKISSDEAFKRLLGARAELMDVSKEVSKKDKEQFKTFVTDPNLDVNRMDTSMQALLESKALDAESKKAIGTIRTYGVGADVMIMYGGLRGEFLPRGGIVEEDTNYDDEDSTGDDEPNWGEVQKYLKRTLDSLQEVIVICRSSGFRE